MYFHFLERWIEDAPSELVENKSDWIYSWENEGKNDKKIGSFKKINLFVGANNSGKSRFLRGLVKSNISFLSISNSEISFKDQYDKSNNQYVLTVKNVLPFLRADISKGYNVIQAKNPYHDLVRNYSESKDILNSLNKKSIEFKSKSKTANYSEVPSYNKAADYYENLHEVVTNVEFIKNNLPKSKKYLPILRTIHENEYLKNGYFKETIKKNYGIQGNVFTGLELFQQVFDLKNSPGHNRRKIKQFEKFLSKHFFNNEEVEITTNKEKNEILFSVNELEHPIYDLGDGIQSLIILLFPIFTANKNDWFFIEEPETNLHPGLQRIFIETLLNDVYLKDKNLKYFFTTHSNHFLDITLFNDEISIFQFQKSKTNRFNIKTNVKPDKEILDILGVNTSSVFLANTSIWIEGPTDRKYISKWLKLYNNSKGELPLKEDIDFAFFEYGGNLIEHYIFGDEIDFNEEEVRSKINSFALSNKIFLLADNDGADGRSSKGKRRKTLECLSKEKVNFLYRNTVCREIENLLPKKVIKEFILELIKGDYDLEKIKSIDFTRKDYIHVGLGDFYENLLINNEITHKNLKSFKAPSGTLMNEYKIKLSNFVVNSSYDYKDFIEDNIELDELVKSLFSFIKQ